MKLIELNEVPVMGPEELWRGKVFNTFGSMVRFNDGEYENLVVAEYEGEVVGYYDILKGGGVIDLDADPEEDVFEARQVWSRRGNKVVKKYRCVSGPRKGRIVGHPKQCNAPVNIKKRIQMNKLRASQGKRMARRAQRTKRVNPSSRRIQRLNRRR